MGNGENQNFPQTTRGGYSREIGKIADEEAGVTAAIDEITDEVEQEKNVLSVEMFGNA